MQVTDIGREFKDWEDTGGAIMAMDLMICVDTAIGHLSGALGHKIWILPPSHPEWRWFLDIDYSPW